MLAGIEAPSPWDEPRIEGTCEDLVDGGEGERPAAFAGIIRCGECGFSVTAEEKVNRYGSRYTYYHCSKRRLDYRCRQRSLERKEVEDQIEEFLLRLRIHPDLHDYALQMVSRDEAEASRLADVEANALRNAIARNELARRNLTKLRIAEQISEAEFERERRELEGEAFRLQGRQQEVAKPDRFEPGLACVLFSIRAAEWFRDGDNHTKRTILEIAGSNPTLTDQKLRIDAAKLFRRWENVASIPALRAVVEDVRTLYATDSEVRMQVRALEIAFRQLRLTDGSNPCKAA